MVAAIGQNQANGVLCHRFRFIIALGHNLGQCRYAYGEAAFRLRLQDHREVEPINLDPSPYSATDLPFCAADNAPHRRYDPADRSSRRANLRHAASNCIAT